MELPTTFPCEGPGSEVFREFLQSDMATARLSRSYRLYYRLRGILPLALRQFLQHHRNRNLHVASDWFIPNEFFERLNAALRGEPKAAIRPWPNHGRFAFVLTHDVETADGLRNINAIAEIEEELGFRSSWNIVPHKYPVDHGLIDD